MQKDKITYRDAINWAGEGNETDLIDYLVLILNEEISIEQARSEILELKD